jgi:crotonobetainyl-CoA:carnitine CoA-transferase CaiB-like acyl-CoA transferase
MKETSRPLQGVRVIDLTTVMFGPYASQFLADFGADVIKVEAPGGDSSRRIGPARETGMAAAFLNLNRSKRSVVLDLKKADAQHALDELLATADVLMFNVRPQKLAAIGLDLKALRERHPRLVVASLNGFSESGPYAGQPAYDDVIQGLCGMADLMHRVSGEMRYLPTTAADKVCGLIAAISILAALAGRDRDGEGRHVEVPMFESMVGFTLVEHWGGQSFVPRHGDSGYSRVLARHRRPLATRDGYLTVMPYTDDQWQRFFDEIGRPDLAADERFNGIAARTGNIDALLAIVSDAVAQRTSAQWVETCTRLDIPVAPVIAIDDLPEDQHLRAVGHFQQLACGEEGASICLPGNGIRIDGRTARPAAPPRLGEHTREVLLQAGLAPAAIDALIHSGAAQ